MWVDSVAQAPANAVFVCNELPDAFPVHLVQWNGSSWEELYVNADFQFTSGPLSRPELDDEVRALPRDLAVGHRMEIGLAAVRWVRELAASPIRGAFFIADYGLDAEEFATRPEGTLRRYHRHQTDDRVLEDLGESDLTCHVPFTRLIDEAARAGLQLRDYDHQGRYLTRLAAPWLQSLEGRGLDAATLRQFQSLTHPAIMGRSFRCLVLERTGRNASAVKP
jgi:SAM-dependent MidA family methyltransferase